MNPAPQSSNSILLVRPAAFGFNAEAAATNVFSRAPSDSDFASRALSEFEELERRLSDAGVEVLVLEDSVEPAKPDAVFPNNWFSSHADGTLVLYPMSTPPRRLERRLDALMALLDSSGFRVERVVDLTSCEESGRFLEGTGSLILDRPRRRAYASLGPRTHPAAIADFERELGYSSFTFEARDRSGQPIYHTNVLMSLGTEFAVLCVDAVAAEQRRTLLEEIEGTGRTLVEISYEQMRQFACNLIELRARDGAAVIVLSSAARASLEPAQLRLLESFGELVDAATPTIEAVGGGSVRCMIAEVHLPRR